MADVQGLSVRELVPSLKRRRRKKRPHVELAALLWGLPAACNPIRRHAGAARTLTAKSIIRNRHYRALVLWTIGAIALMQT